MTWGCRLATQLYPVSWVLNMLPGPKLICCQALQVTDELACGKGSAVLYQIPSARPFKPSCCSFQPYLLSYLAATLPDGLRWTTICCLMA